MRFLTKDLKDGRLWLEDKAAEKRWSELPHHMRDSTVNVLSTLIAHHHGSVSKEDGDRRVVLFMEGMPREWIDPQEWLLSQV